jgi:hypothetical protein
MSGHSMRFALPEDERPPIDQRPREPELELQVPAPSITPMAETLARQTKPVAPPPTAQTAERLSTPPVSPHPPERLLGAPPAAELSVTEIGKEIITLLETHLELRGGFEDDKRGIMLSAVTRIETMAGILRKMLEPKRGVK